MSSKAKVSVCIWNSLIFVQLLLRVCQALDTGFRSLNNAWFLPLEEV